MQLAYYQYIADSETARDATDPAKQDLLIAQATKSLHRAIESYLLLTLSQITASHASDIPPEEISLQTIMTPIHQTITEQIATCQQSSDQPSIECTLLSTALEQ